MLGLEDLGSGNLRYLVVSNPWGPSYHPYFDGRNPWFPVDNFQTLPLQFFPGFEGEDFTGTI